MEMILLLIGSMCPKAGLQPQASETIRARSRALKAAAELSHARHTDRAGVDTQSQVQNQGLIFEGHTRQNSISSISASSQSPNKRKSHLR